MELEGKVIVINDTIVVNDKFQKREFVIEKSESNNGTEFTDTIKLQLTQSRCDSLNNVHIGDRVKVQFNIRGNKWIKDGKTSYFVNLDAWKIDVLQTGSAAPEFDKLPDQPEDENDLPF